ncbi:hypothetical protein EIP86_003322 [Pleurotus ostreatoroseus]|nr:hypothetical protein EIP86_003322 [Pleurotus ostreatoroseus]
MFFSVAWLRLPLAIAFLAPLSAQAHLNSIFTSSVSYCSPPESILVQQFDVAYIEQNASVNFNVSAASVLPNINVTANLFVNVYGMQPINETIDLCKLLNGVLCPLPTYNFTGADSITLPSSIDLNSYLPGIAYIIPDLEAFAQLTLTEVGTNDVRACIQSTLSNGWSIYQKGVEWATGAVALLALVSAVFYSWFSPETLTAVRLLDVIYLFQAIATSGLLALNYPIVYRSYTLNYSWVLGLFAMSPNSGWQKSIDNMRRLTGGDVDGSADGGSAVSLVNRKLSPYNNFVIPQQLTAQASVQPSVDIAEFISGNYTLSGPPVTDFTAVADANVLVGGDVATVTAGSDNVLQAGIPIYTNDLGIQTTNAFMTAFFVALILALIVLGALALGYGILYAWTRSSWRRDTAQRALANYPTFARAWALRGALVCTTPVLVLAFYQWTLKDSWLAILLSVLLLVALLACVLPPLFLVLHAAVPLRLPLPARWAPSDSTAGPSHALAPFVAALRPERHLFLVPVVLAVLVRALVIAFGQGHGLAQVIVLLILEILMLAFVVIMRPHRTRGGDVLSGFFAIARVVCTGLLVAFAESIDLAPIPRVAIGIVIAVIYSVVVVFVFVNVVWNMGAWRVMLLFRKKRNATTGATTLVGANGSHASLEKGHGSPDPKKEKGTPDPDGDGGETPPTLTITPASSTQFYLPHHLHHLQHERPANPSPTHTPTTLSEFSPVPTEYTRSSVMTRTSVTTTTLGEPLPHRWSFQHSRPPSLSVGSPSAMSHTHSMRTSSALSPTTESGEQEVYETPRHSWQTHTPSPRETEHLQSHPEQES